jgi:translation initiation factor IF-2
VVVHEGKVSSLKRFKDDVRSVSAGFECGVGLEDFNDLKESDILEIYQMREVTR